MIYMIIIYLLSNPFLTSADSCLSLCFICCFFFLFLFYKTKTLRSSHYLLRVRVTVMQSFILLNLFTSLLFKYQTSDTLSLIPSVHNWEFYLPSQVFFFFFFIRLVSIKFILCICVLSLFLNASSITPGLFLPIATSPHLPSPPRCSPPCYICHFWLFNYQLKSSSRVEIVPSYKWYIVRY